MSLSENPRARQALYIVAFVAAALSLFAPLIPGALGATLGIAFQNLAALATVTASATALSNMSPKAPAPTANDFMSGPQA